MKGKNVPLLADISFGDLLLLVVEVAFFATGGALLLVMRALLDGDLDESADIPHCEGLLRLLGLSGDEVIDISRRANEAASPA